MNNSNIKKGAFVKVVKGELTGRVYQVFDKSFSGLTLKVGIKPELRHYKVQIDDIEIVSEEEFNDYNQDTLIQDILFFNTKP